LLLWEPFLVAGHSLCEAACGWGWDLSGSWSFPFSVFGGLSFSVEGSHLMGHSKKPPLYSSRLKNVCGPTNGALYHSLRVWDKDSRVYLALFFQAPWLIFFSFRYPSFPSWFGFVRGASSFSPPPFLLIVNKCVLPPQPPCFPPPFRFCARRLPGGPRFFSVGSSCFGK